MCDVCAEYVVRCHGHWSQHIVVCCWVVCLSLCVWHCWPSGVDNIVRLLAGPASCRSALVGCGRWSRFYSSSTGP